MGTPGLWIGFNLAVLAMLFIDLALMQRAPGGVTPVRAGGMVCASVGLSIGFCAAMWRIYGGETAQQFLTAYVLEYALSVDNLFVFLLVFGYFRVAPHLRHRILFWGVLGAFVMRAGLIVLGTALVRSFQPILYVFGAFLIYTAWKMAFANSEAVDPEHNPVLRLARRFLPMAHKDTGDALVMVREEGQLRFTPLFLVLLVVEATDLVFALDSIPAALGVSSNPFIVYSANVCAIVGLRSLFFVVASLMDKFHYLKFGLSAVLGFIGLKMLVMMFDVHVPTWMSLTVIVVMLGSAMCASVLWPATASQDS